MSEANILKLGIPKGSLERATIDLFAKAGWKINISSRNYFPSVDDKELKLALLRAQEMSRYVENGTLDAGITGKDWILENESKVEYIQELLYSKESHRPARWVLVVTGDSPVKSIKDLDGKRIATEMVNFTKKYFQERGVKITVEFSWGATEAKLVEGLVDAIVDVTETGSTLRAHGLRIVEEMMTSCPWVIANKSAWEDPWKRGKIEQIALLLKGALLAENMVGLKMNVPPGKLEEVVALLPSLSAPTIANLHMARWHSVETVVSENLVRELIPKLLKAGAEGIIEYSLNKVV